MADYHVTINGFPACTMPALKEIEYGREHGEYPNCGHNDFESAQHSAEIYARIYPGADIEVILSVCPEYVRSEDELNQ